MVVLGHTGRNFAAGMSGGIAFVYDEDGTFNERCNTGMVDMKPLHDESVRELRSMLENHFRYTESTVARAILRDWSGALGRFVRVMPRDYARVLKQRKERETEEMTHVAQ